MKKTLIIFLIVLIAFPCAGCGKDTAENIISVTAENQDDEEGLKVFPDTFPQTGDKKAGDENSPTVKTGKENDMYDPGIFVIEAAGSWRQELAQGYYADYECELYLDKFDANDNRSSAGLYTGAFWMKTTLNADEYLKELLKSVPVEMDFAGGGEGICDNLTMHLLDGYQRDPFKDFSIPGGNAPEKEALAGEGSFIAVGKDAYLNVNARGAGGETLQHEASDVSNAEIFYVIQIEPDPSKTADELKAIIHLSNAEGMSVSIEGKWHRLSGYPEDRIKYANEGRHAEFLDKHLQ